MSVFTLFKDGNILHDMPVFRNGEFFLYSYIIIEGERVSLHDMDQRNIDIVLGLADAEFSELTDTLAVFVYMGK